MKGEIVSRSTTAGLSPRDGESDGSVMRGGGIIPDA
jgi:hypothetical protein